MEWTGNEMVHLDCAGRILSRLKTESLDYWSIDNIADAIPIWHKQAHLSDIPLVTSDADKALTYICKTVIRLPEWLRGGVPSEDEEQFTHQVHAAARRNVLRRERKASVR